jgi:hypothetical protein
LGDLGSLRFFAGSIGPEAALGIIEIVVPDGAVEFIEDIVLLGSGDLGTD